MSRRLVPSGDALTRMMAVAHLLGGGRDLDDILQIIARTVTELIAFDAVAVNVRRDDGLLEVRAVVGPPEIEALAGSTMPETGWVEFLVTCEQWGGLYFSRADELSADMPVATPWEERVVVPRHEAREPVTPAFLPREPWRAEYALLAPVWSDGQV